jgi:ketosteroid isomerase-like protein
VRRPEEGLIVLAYKAEAKKEGGEAYTAHCTSVLRRLAHDEWRVVQHQQTPPIVAQANG